VARNRKRAKERRARQRQPVATTRGERAEHDDTIDPIRHATPDVELAEAQLALGRPDLADSEAAESQGDEPADAAEPSDDSGTELSEADFRSEEDLADAAEAGGFEMETGYDEAEPADAGGGRGRRGRRAGPDEGGGGDGASSAALPAHRARAGSRLVTFLQGSWRELQRVQWPDRRQVIQATGVVIGFVIVAGVYLGVADTVASHLMNWILK
jgi:preprotein translocase subunit SecE